MAYDPDKVTAFISYCHKPQDEGVAHSLIGRLEGAGWQVILDKHTAGGSEWKRAIERGIQAADCVIALVSDASMDSDWCRKEWRTAKDLRDRRHRPHIIPLRLDGRHRIPDEFTDIQIVAWDTHEAEKPTEAFEKCLKTAEAAKREHDFWGDAFYEHDLQLAVAKRSFEGGSLQTDVAKVLPNAEPEGVDYWLAVQDIRAAVELTNKLGAERGTRGIQVVHGGDVNLPAGNHCAIALGLGFNKLTRRLESKFGESLYKVTFGPSAREIQNLPPERHSEALITDDFVLHGFEAEELPNGFDRALIARIVLPAEALVGYCVYFVCAGRTAPGTVAAAWFLANRWRELFGLYKDTWSLTRDSVAAILWHPQNGIVDDFHDEPAWREDVWQCVKQRARGF